MYRSINRFLFILLAWLGFLPLWAQTPTATPASSSSLELKPIDARFSTLSGLSYTQGGEELKNYGDFQEVLAPIHDFEARRLLNKSESSLLDSKLLESLGLVSAIVGVTGLLTSSSNQQTPFWITAVGGAVLFDIGTFFGTEAQTCKFNAVQRYNRFAYGREQVLPQVPTDAKSLLPVAAPSIAATPTVQDGVK
jgi:hypothetical protein